MIASLLLVLAGVLCLLIYYLNKRTSDFWKVREVPFLQPWPLVGNYWKYVCLKGYIGEVSAEICDKFADEPYFGVFYGTEPALVILDPDVIKLITTKDFYYFSSREVSQYTHNEVMTQNMFFTYGDRWKLLRQNFTTLFSSGKMKNMFYLIEKCNREFEGLLEELAESGDVVEIRSLMARYTMDCIGSCAFGINTNAMGNDVETNPFSKIGHMIFELSNARGLGLVGRSMYPAIFYGLGFKTFPEEMDRFFHKVLTDVFKARNYEPSARNDFIDLLLHLTKQGYIEGEGMSSYKSEGGKKISMKVDDELLVAQCLSFFAAGFETSATALSFTLYELAKNQAAQARAAEEAASFLRRRGRLDYECVAELPYLEACILEALRLYPGLGVVTREVAHEYSLRGARLPRGLRVHIPVYWLHRNPRHFPAPAAFTPDRFLPHNKHTIHPYTFMPFGEGPRNCPGSRFAKMQMLAGLVTLLSRYRVQLAPGTPARLPLEPRGLVTEPACPINLKLVARATQ